MQMEKDKIKKILRETTLDEVRHAKHNPHLNTTTKTQGTAKDKEKPDFSKIRSLLQNNDIFNHAAIVRRLKHEPWAGNTEATNRSLFRKQLNNDKNDEDGNYDFSDETASSIQKILMGVSSTINHEIGHQGT